MASFKFYPSSKSVVAIISASVAIFLSGCASKPVAPENKLSANATDTQIYKPTGFENLFGFIKPYRISIQQGNFVSQEMAVQLKEGMNREQVRFILGTALLTDMFHEDRWDYPFRMLKPNGEVITSRLSVYFKDNLVSRFDGGSLPTEKEYLAHISSAAIASRIETLQTEDAAPASKKK